MLRKVIGVVIAGVLLFIGAWTPLTAEQRDQTAQKSPATTPVNLNTATVADLEKLPGVGAATAARIIEYREKNGPFKKIEDILETARFGRCLLMIPSLSACAPVSGCR